ncbi:hypothetical protein C8R46DRAFT_1208636 [Mycena filopes]|nr:hypothetical protein C8R46DRAFT_1208636 [Mycena filopes]
MSVFPLNAADARKVQRDIDFNEALSLYNNRLAAIDANGHAPAEARPDTDIAANRRYAFIPTKNEYLQRRVDLDNPAHVDKLVLSHKQLENKLAVVKMFTLHSTIDDWVRRGTQDAEIEELKTQCAALSGRCSDLEGRNVELEDHNVELEGRNVELDSANAELGRHHMELQLEVRYLKAQQQIQFAIPVLGMLPADVDEAGAPA